MLNTRGTFADLVASLLGVFNIIIPALCALALVLFMYGMVKYVYKRQPGDYKTMLWSLIALFVLFSIWGILRVLMNTLLVR